MSETESQTADSEDEASSVATHGSESPMTGDSDTEQEEADPWMPMVEEAMQTHKAAFQEMKMNLTHSGLWMSKPLEKQLTLIFCLSSKSN